ncbi:hypothetical protein SAMN05444166_2545 [Singulisphaera sp. GP187]|nr:hypothetical protein SAMN05444166_2545 [Singulisphaera sp. GP187]
MSEVSPFWEGRPGRAILTFGGSCESLCVGERRIRKQSKVEGHVRAAPSISRSHERDDEIDKFNVTTALRRRQATPREKEGLVSWSHDRLPPISKTPSIPTIGMARAFRPRRGKPVRQSESTTRHRARNHPRSHGPPLCLTHKSQSSNRQGIASLKPKTFGVAREESSVANGKKRRGIQPQIGQIINRLIRKNQQILPDVTSGLAFRRIQLVGKA